MKLVSGRVVFDLVLLAGAAWGLIQARALPAAFGPGQIGPGDFPSAVIVIAIIAILAVLFQDLRTLRQDQEPKKGETRIGLSESLGISSIAILLVAYIAVLEALGFLVATTVFLFLTLLACTWFLDRPQGAAAWRRLLIVAAVIAIAGSGLSFAVFTYGFGLIFP